MRKDQKAALQTIWNMFNGNHEALGEKKQGENKPSFDLFKDAGESRQLPHAAPECCGLSSEKVRLLLEELASAKDLSLHHFMLLVRGQIIAECHFHPYRKELWHVTYSMCKSITGMAVGMLVEEGRLKLDDGISHFFEDQESLFDKLRHKKLTVRHLLSMTSAVAFKEAGMVLEGGWAKEFLGAPMEGEPGAAFDYNSMNSYLLSVIITKVTGESLFDYLKPRLWEPLGIRKVWWETCPDGYTKGGWGLYLCAEDMAKLGQLYLQKGCWNGVQLVPEWWVKESTSRKVEVPADGASGYGYQIWLGMHQDSYLFNGMFGQNVAVYPEWDAVVVTCAGNSELFQEGSMFALIDRHLTAIFSGYHGKEDDQCASLFDERISQDAKAKEAFGTLLCTQRRISSGAVLYPAAIRRGWNRHGYAKGSRSTEQNAVSFLHGRRYNMEENNVGLLPVILQVLHGSYTEGIQKISFTVEQGKIYMNMEEGKDCNSLCIGLNHYEESQIYIKGESFLVSSKGALRKNEDDVPVFKIGIKFLEEAVSRELKVHFLDANLKIYWDETPGLTIIRKGFDTLFTEFMEKKLLQSVSGYGAELFELLAEKMLHPVTGGVRTKEQKTKDDIGPK